MSTTNNDFTVEALVTKYRNYVMEHTPMESDGYGEIPISIYDAHADVQLLTNLYVAVTKDKVDEQIVNCLCRYSKQFYKNALSKEEFAFLCENFKTVVSYEFNHRNEWIFKDSHISISEEKIKLAKEHIKPEKDQTIFIANTEFCDLAVLFPGCTIKGFTNANHPDMERWALGQIRMFAAGIKSEIDHGKMVDTGEYKWSWDDDDSTEKKTINDPIQKFAYSVPKKGSVDVVIWGACGELSQIMSVGSIDIEELYELLKPNGKMLVFSDDFPEIVGNKAEELIHFRNRIIKEKTLTAILAYKDEEAMTSITKKKKTHTLLVITKKPHEMVLIKNEEKDVCHTIDIEQINSDILWANYYLTNRPSNGMPLSSLASVVIDDHVHNLGKIINDFDNEKVKIVLPDDVMNMSVLYPKDFGVLYKDTDLMTKNLLIVSDIVQNNEWIPESDYPSIYRILWGTKVDKPCVFLYAHEGKMKVGYLNDQNVDKYLRIKNVVPCLIPKEGIDVRYLAAMLLLPEVKQQIVAFFDGISCDDKTLSLVLDKIIVPYHNEKERIHFLAEANYDAWKSTQEEMEQEHNNYMKAIRMRKHALTQSLSSVNSMMNTLNSFRLRNNGQLFDEDRISRVTGTTVKDAFKFLSENINDMMPVIDHLADVEYSFGHSESFDIEEFISNYISIHEKGWTNFKAITNWPTKPNSHKLFIENNIEKKYREKEKAEKILFFPKKALERILNDIISNAQAHAFKDDNRKDYKIVFSWNNDGLNLNLEIQNNGNPLPKDRDVKSLFEYGVSTSLHKDGHNGIGCHEIEDIMNRYKSSVQLVSTPKEEFTVKYILSFNSNVLA